MKSREISRSKIGPFSLACTDPYIGIGCEYHSSVVVHLANRRKVRVEVQRNTGGDTPSISVAVHADLRICGGYVIYSLVRW